MIAEKKNKKIFILNLFRQNKTFVLLSVIFLFGIFIGAISGENIDNKTFENINKLFLSNIEARGTNSFLYIFVSSLSSSFIFILLAFFMGLSMWGCILLPILPFFKGFCLGISQNYLYCSYGIKGLGFQLLVLLPGIFISVIALLLMSREAMRLSHNFSTFMLFGTREPFGRRDDIKMYLLRTGCVLIISVFASIIDTVFNMLFLNIFHF